MPTQHGRTNSRILVKCPDNLPFFHLTPLYYFTPVVSKKKAREIPSVIAAELASPSLLNRIYASLSGNEPPFISYDAYYLEEGITIHPVGHLFGKPCPEIRILGWVDSRVI